MTNKNQLDEYYVSDRDIYVVAQEFVNLAILVLQNDGTLAESEALKMLSKYANIDSLEISRYHLEAIKILIDQE